MNPFFIAHIIADFLLQPKALVAWKQKSIFGLLAHAAAYLLTMCILIVPFAESGEFLKITILLISLTLAHGIIDQIKINYQKTHHTFESIFFIDQFAHLVTVFAAAILSRMPVAHFWAANGGAVILSLLAFFSYGISIGGLFQIDRYPIQNTRHRILRFGVITAVFLMYIIPARLFAFSFCF